MTEHFDLVLHAPRAVTGGGEGSCSVAVRNGRIAAIADFGIDLPADRVVTLAADEVLLPGLVDTHVHVNDPGRTEWEGFASATRAAAAGGVTTIVDMPLNSLPPTVDVAALEVKRKAAEENCFVDGGSLGRRHSRQRGRPSSVARCRGLRIQVLPGRLRCGGIPPSAARRIRLRGARRCRIRWADDRARRGRKWPWNTRRARTAVGTTGSWPPGHAVPRIWRSPR